MSTQPNSNSEVQVPFSNLLKLSIQTSPYQIFRVTQFNLHSIRYVRCLYYVLTLLRELEILSMYIKPSIDHFKFELQDILDQAISLEKLVLKIGDIKSFRINNTTLNYLVLDLPGVGDIQVFTHQIK